MLAAILFVACRSTPSSVVGPVGAHPEPRAPEVVAYGFTVSDLDASVGFFTNTFGATVQGAKDIVGEELSALTGLHEPKARRATIALGAQRVVLTDYVTEGATSPRAPVSNSSAFQHLAIVTRDIDTAFGRIAEAGATSISTGGPQTIPLTNPAAGGIRAVYLRDADAHALALIGYPPSKGAAAWHASEGPLVLGIDHSAIGVADTERALRFYRDRLGLAVRGTSLNQGVEQAALSGVAGAVVKVTGLGGPAGPGVELLSYLAPGFRSETPAEPNDRAFWHTSIAVDDVDVVWADLQAAGVAAVSKRVADCSLCVVGTRGVIVRDPDGHAVLIEERP